MFALVACQGVRTVACWLLSDVDMIDVAGRAGQLDHFLRAVVGPAPGPAKDKETLRGCAIVHIVKGLRCMCPKSPQPLLL